VKHKKFGAFLKYLSFKEGWNLGMGMKIIKNGVMSHRNEFKRKGVCLIVLLLLFVVDKEIEE